MRSSPGPSRRSATDRPTSRSTSTVSIPASRPGTGTPEVGGLTPSEALAILRGCIGIDVVGADVVEVSPSYDTGNITAQAGAQVLFTLACLAVEARKRRRG